MRAKGLELVAVALLNRAVPASYVTRLVSELADHRRDLIRDLTMQGMSAEAAEGEADRRLGDPNTLADAALAGLRLGSFIGRHRVCSLIVLPVVLLLAGWVALLLLGAWMAGLLAPGFRAGNTTEQGRMVLHFACVACGYAVHAVLAVYFYLLARRRFCGTAWAWTPCLILAAIASCTFIVTRLAGDTSGTGRLVIGVAASPDLLKLAMPLGAVLLLECLSSADACRSTSPG